MPATAAMLVDVRVIAAQAPPHLLSLAKGTAARFAAPMEVTIHRPGPHLSDCVTAMVCFSGLVPDWQRERLLPDGVIEIVVDLSNRPKRLFRDEFGTAGTDFRDSWVSGVHRRPIIIEAQPMATMLAISFTPGGARPFLGTDCNALTDGVFSLDSVIGHAASSLRDRVLAAPTLHAMFHQAESWLLERSGGPVRRNPLIAHLARRIEDGARSIRALVEETGRSERHVQTVSRQWLGTSLKHYARMRRFQRLISGLSAGVAVDWADQAQALGYFDQSHLSHEFLAFSGLTPARYGARYAGLCDFLPIMAQGDCGFLQDGGPAPSA